MTVEKRTCELPGCSAEIPKGILMCKAHWAEVPAEIRRRINAAWRVVRSPSRDKSPEDRLDAITAYRNAVADAVAAVQSALP